MYPFQGMIVICQLTQGGALLTLGCFILPFQGKEVLSGQKFSITPKGFHISAQGQRSATLGFYE